MKKYLVDMLECPHCHHRLKWKIETETEDQIEQAEAHCSTCGASYPIKEGIGIFLTPDLQRKDLWGEVESQLSLYLKSHPDHERKLMAGPAENLSPTDQQFRAMVLDERGEFEEARRVEARDVVGVGMIIPLVIPDVVDHDGNLVTIPVARDSEGVVGTIVVVGRSEERRVRGIDVGLELLQDILRLGIGDLWGRPGVSFRFGHADFLGWRNGIAEIQGHPDFGNATHCPELVPLPVIEAAVVIKG